MTPGNRQNVKEKIKLFRFLPSAVNVKYKPFDISPLPAGEYQCYLRLASDDLNICIMSCGFHIIKIHVV